jgi:hypothetical protein
MLTIGQKKNPALEEAGSRNVHLEGVDPVHKGMRGIIGS